MNHIQFIDVQFSAVKIAISNLNEFVAISDGCFKIFLDGLTLFAKKIRLARARCFGAV